MDTKCMSLEYGTPNDRRKIQIQLNSNPKLRHFGKESVAIFFVRKIRRSNIMKNGEVIPASFNFRRNGESFTQLNLEVTTLKALYDLIGEYLK